MTFLAPLGAIALLAIPAILLLYFLKVRRPEVRVGALLFWRPYLADRQANAPWQRLRASLLLILQLLAAAALAFALLRPGVPGVAGVGKTTVVMIDGSASMQATDVAPNRFAVAVAQAKQRAGQLGPGQEMAVVLVGAHAELLAPPSSDPAVLDAALDRARPSAGEVDLGEAFSLANAIAAGRAGAEIVLIGDGHAKAPPGVTKLNAKLTYVPIGSSAENAAIEAISRTRDGVFIRVADYGRQPRDLRVEMFADGKLADVLPLHVDGNSSADLNWTGLPNGTQIVQARLTPEDVFPLDDSAWLITAPPASRGILLVTEENGFLQRALGLRPGVKVTTVAPKDYKPGSYDLYVFDGWLPKGQLPAPALIVNPPAGEGPVPAGAPLNPGAVLPPDPRDPLTADVHLQDVHVRDAAKVSVPSGWRAPITAVNDPLLLVHEGESRSAELSFDIHHSDLPLRAAFPILVQNLLGYLLPGGFENQVYAAGQQVQLAPEPGAKAISVTSPKGRSQALTPASAPPPYTDTATPGIYAVREALADGSTRDARFIVQFSDPLLSHIETLGAPLIGIPDTDQAPPPPSRGTLELWPYLAVAALALLCLEWLVFHRGRLRWA